MHNFGVYASDNTFVFNNEKPVVLIGGMNGRGKTTFLEAILLALYGKNSFAVQESIYGAYSNYLTAHTNTVDGTSESFVELEFEIAGIFTTSIPKIKFRSRKMAIMTPF